MALKGYEVAKVLLLGASEVLEEYDKDQNLSNEDIIAIVSATFERLIKEYAD